jgi:hypothetical protein
MRAVAARVVYHGNGRGARRSATNRRARFKGEYDALPVIQRNVHMWVPGLASRVQRSGHACSVLFIQAEVMLRVEARVEDGDVGEPRPQGSEFPKGKTKVDHRAPGSWTTYAEQSLPELPCKWLTGATASAYMHPKRYLESGRKGPNRPRSCGGSK